MIIFSILISLILSSLVAVINYLLLLDTNKRINDYFCKIDNLISDLEKEIEIRFKGE